MAIPPPQNPPELSQKLVDLIIELGPQTHTGAATMLSSRLEKTLEQILQVSMPGLSGNLKARLFSGYGPLASFSAKIDIAKALGIVPPQLSTLLHAIKKIRNEFAHADDEIHFRHPKIRTLVEKLPGTTKKDSYAAFAEAIMDANKQLGSIQERLTLLAAGAEPKTHGKS